MPVPTLLLALFLGVGLSASAGLNAFLPLLLLGAAARFHVVPGLALNGSFAWLTSDVALVVLIIASIIEIVADKVPAVDHALHAAGTVVRPLAATLAAASVLKGVDPAVASVVGLIIGAPTSLGFHALKSGTRVASSATTLGCANPVISLVEDCISFAIAVLSILLPLAVPLILAVVAFAAWRLMRRTRQAATPARI
jgi:hypothetical protein